MSNQQNSLQPEQKRGIYITVAVVVILVCLPCRLPYW